MHACARFWRVLKKSLFHPSGCEADGRKQDPTFSCHSRFRHLYPSCSQRIRLIHVVRSNPFLSQSVKKGLTCSRLLLLSFSLSLFVRLFKLIESDPEPDLEDPKETSDIVLSCLCEAESVETGKSRSGDMLGVGATIWIDGEERKVGSAGAGGGEGDGASTATSGMG